MESPYSAKHVAKIERKHGGCTYISYLLRQSYRAAGKVKHRTLANLAHLPEPLIDLVRRSLRGERFVTSHESVRTLSSKPHGHAEAVSTCVYTLTPDRYFLIDQHAESSRGVVAAGFSGHGFEFAPLVGVALDGKTRWPVELCRRSQLGMD